MSARVTPADARICRCGNCGAWMILTPRHGGQQPPCSHLTPKQPRKDGASA